MGVFEQSDTEIHKHLGILVNDFVRGQGMVNGLVKENRDQVRPA